jgi:hypothetical protein
MKAKPLSMNRNSLLALGSAALLAGAVAILPAHAASRDTNGLNQPITSIHQASPSWRALGLQVADSDGDSDNSSSKASNNNESSKTRSSSATRQQKAERTNQTTGAKDRNAGPMSKQKGNQPKSAVKAD